ncbi:MAG TPA: SDR family oxidoreductase [Povalibacter sp.]|jgi:3-oxoacyl-[acyl-carrier protein] reductase|nr:SDR family oxidoreductase [Povalibacter sp.]
MQLEQKLVVITGSGRGIGRAMALAFARRQSNLALLDLNQDDLDQTCAQCTALGVQARSYICNVAREDQVVATLDAVVRDFGSLDVMINNAGITRDALLVKVQDGKVVGRMSLAQWQSVIDVDLTGVFLGAREAAAHMIELGRGGVIISTSSISRAGNMGQTNYSAAKAGVTAMTVVWAKELARHGIRTGAIAPGFTHTEILDAMKPEMIERALAAVPLRRLAEPEEMAHAAVFIAENDYFSGRVIELDGGQRL